MMEFFFSLCLLGMGGAATFGHEIKKSEDFHYPPPERPTMYLFLSSFDLFFVFIVQNYKILLKKT